MTLSDEAFCPHPMREGENTSNPDGPGRCLLCGTPWDQVEADRARLQRQREAFADLRRIEDELEAQRGDVPD